MENINGPNNNLKTEVNICRYSHGDSFETAYTYILAVISHLLTATQIYIGGYGKRWQVNSSGKVVRGGICGLFEFIGGRNGGGQGGHGEQGKGNINQI